MKQRGVIFHTFRRFQALGLAVFLAIVILGTLQLLSHYQNDIHSQYDHVNQTTSGLIPYTEDHDVAGVQTEAVIDYEVSPSTPSSDDSTEAASGLSNNDTPANNTSPQKNKNRGNKDQSSKKSEPPACTFMGIPAPVCL